MKPSQSHILNVRGLRYHVRTWGEPSQPQLWLAHGWADALIGIASANGKVNADLTGQAILIMHNDVFQKNNLDPSTWTLYAPAQVLGPTQFNALFSDLLNSQGDMAKEIAMDAKIFFQMEACAQYCTDPALQNASLKWIGTAVNSLFSDIDFFLAEDARVGNAIPSGVLLNNLKSNSLTIGSDVNISALADQLANHARAFSGEQLQAHLEEAGVIGKVSKQPIGSYPYEKTLEAGEKARCRVQVFALRVTRQHKRWPEKHQRQIGWYAPDEALRFVGELHLRRIIRKFAKWPNFPFLQIMKRLLRG